MKWPWRKAQPPAPVQPRLTRADADVLHRAGLTLTQWQALTDQERAELRWRLGL